MSLLQLSNQSPPAPSPVSIPQHAVPNDIGRPAILRSPKPMSLLPSIMVSQSPRVLRVQLQLWRCQRLENAGPPPEGAQTVRHKISSANPTASSPRRPVSEEMTTPDTSRHRSPQPSSPRIPTEQKRPLLDALLPSKSTDSHQTKNGQTRLCRALRDVVDAYLLGIMQKCQKCETRMRRMLQEYPYA